MGSTQPRRELYVNTIVTWVWTQGTLLASVLALPLLTRFLPKAEFALWSQMLALSALATLADFGLSAVFLRRITASPQSSAQAGLKAARAFYRATGAVLAAALVVVCLIPGGFVSPFLTSTHSPRLTALVIIVAIVVNLLVQPSAIRMLSRGRLDLANVFGAGPAVVGTLATVLAAHFFHSALAVGIAYAAVELLFDIALVALVAWSQSFHFQDRVDAPAASFSWASMFSESRGVLIIGLTPQLIVLADTFILGRIVGPAAVAVYAVASKVGDLVTRLFWPFSASLFISLCRTTGAQRLTVEKHAVSLGWLAITSGLGLGCAVAAVGPRMVTLIFGGGYGRAESAIIVLLAAATLRSMYMPEIRRIQADVALGSVPKWFVAGLIAHVFLALALTAIWSTLGTAAAVFASVLLFEAWPAARAARRHPSKGAPSDRVSTTQLRVSVIGAAALLLLTWCRIRFGGWSIAACGAAAAALAAVSVSQIVRYLRSSRGVLLEARLVPD